MISEDDLQELGHLLGPCTVCKGKGGFNESPAPGERSRFYACSVCGGKKTAVAQNMGEEYLRGWKDAFAAMEKSLTSLKRSHRL